MKLLIVFIAILVAVYILTPRFWEPSEESWKQWAAARILRETGGFPVFSLGPAYVTYLQLFLFFPYPYNIQMEYFITHIFVYIAIFLMLQSFLPHIFAFMITCAWMPALSILEPGGAVAGIGFMALYFNRNIKSSFNKGFFPNSLLLASLCHSAYLPFLIGNIIGVFAERRIKKEPLFDFSREMHIFPFLLKIGLFILVILIIIFPSQRWDHNHMLMDQRYAPIPLRGPLSIAFFQIGNWKYVIRTVPKPLWVYQDWYFTNAKAFGGATTILQAVFKKTNVVIANIWENIFSLIQLPKSFIFGNFHGFLATAVSLTLLFIGLFGVGISFWKKESIPFIFSILFGSIFVICALLLTWFGWRYCMTLLPVWLLIISYIQTGFKHIAGLRPKSYLLISNIVIIFSAASILFSAPYPYGKATQIKALLGKQVLLNRHNSRSMILSYPKLLNSINKATNTIALEDTWIKAFASVKLDNIYNVFSLPPFPDISGKTEQMLNNMDVILVSFSWSRQEPAVATQYFLRYRLHIEPFLKKAIKEGWTAQDVEGYGKIYKRPVLSLSKI